MFKVTAHCEGKVCQTASTEKMEEELVVHGSSSGTNSDHNNFNEFPPFPSLGGGVDNEMKKPSEVEKEVTLGEDELAAFLEGFEGTEAAAQDLAEFMLWFRQQKQMSCG